MPNRVVTRRTQFSSCDECRRSRVACDAQNNVNHATGNPSPQCTRCRNRNQTCTFNWLQNAKVNTCSGAKQKSRRKTPSRPTSDTSSTHGSHPINISPKPGNGNIHASEVDNDAGDSNSAALVAPESASLAWCINLTRDSADISSMEDLDTSWLDTLFREGFEVVFGSWMGRYSCPFLFGDSRADKYVSISDLCRHLDGCIVDSGNSQLVNQAEAEQSLRSTISAFAARWLPVTSQKESHETHCNLVQNLWRYARRDMLRVINRPSYRSMLSLFLFALTPIPEGISEEEETDGISGQACVHAALQQIQTLRARHKNLQFSGSKVSPSLRSEPIVVTTPESIESSGFINAESTVYWAALTFDTSASLTLNCRPLLSSGLFGFESELPWRLVRTCAKMFDENARQWKQVSSDMTDERANQIIAAGASWKLLGWKLTAIFKEALRDGHEEPEVRKAYFAVVDSIKQFGIIYRPLLDDCHKRMPFLGQQTKLRWFSLMLHYHLSILMLVDMIEATDRQDLLPDITDISIDAENTVMNTLAFGLHNTFTLKRPHDDTITGGKAVFTIPIVSIDPYPHHAVAGVQLLRKAVDRDFGIGKITEETYQSLLWTLERTLRHLPQSSKSVQAAIAKFSTVPGEIVHNQIS